MTGFLNVNKPAGMTSSDVVVKVRGRLKKLTGDKELKLGHMGTLDPAAEGVLVLAVGRAARLFDFFIGKRKLYLADFVFGMSTDTLDRDGAVTVSGDRLPSEEEIRSAALRLVGEIMQIPPSYSAKSVGGVRAYDAARKGIEFEIPAKKVTVNSIELSSFDGKLATFRIDCLGGTYIRSIARDMAESIGTSAYMSRLIRLAAGPFRIEDAVSPDKICGADRAEDIALIPIISVLEDMPRFNIEAGRLLEKLKNGVRAEADGLPEGDFTLFADGELFGIAHAVDSKIVIKTRLC